MKDFNESWIEEDEIEDKQFNAAIEKIVSHKSEYVTKLFRLVPGQTYQLLFSRKMPCC